MSLNNEEERSFLGPISEANFSEKILKMFPTGTKVIDYKEVSEQNYTASLRLKCNSKENFRIWLDEFQNLSSNIYRVAKTVPRAGKIVIYKAVFRCHHNTYPDSHYGRVKAPSKKHTGCSATLRVVIKSPVEGRRVRTKDELRGEYPCVVTILNDHNHSIDVMKAVTHKNPNKKIRKKHIDEFKNQHASAESLDINKRDLSVENDEKLYENIIAQEMKFHKVAVGNANIDPNWYLPLLLKSDCTKYFPQNDPEEETSSTSTDNCPEEPLESEEETDEEQIMLEDSKEKLKEMFMSLEEKLSKNPTDFSLALNSMYTNFINIKDESNLLSAIYNFGKL